MTKQQKEFAELLKPSAAPEQSMGAIEAIKEGIQLVAPGLSLSKILHDVGHELKEQLSHGSHEMASALFRGDAFVMYPRTNQADGPEHGVHGEATKPQEMERDRGGMEM